MQKFCKCRNSTSKKYITLYCSIYLTECTSSLIIVKSAYSISSTLEHI